MSAREVIEQIKQLSPMDQVRVMQNVIENGTPPSAGQTSISVAEDGLPVIRAQSGTITSNLVRELESMSP